MKDLKQELEKLSTTLDGLKEAIDHNFGLLNIAVANIIKKADEESGGCRIVPFDIEKAKQGAKVVTTLGQEVRILCYDRKSNLYPIVALIEDPEYDEESIENYTKEGKAYIHQDRESDLRILE